MTSLAPSAVPALFPDVPPTPQTDLSTVCSISYSDDFKLAYDYLRTVLRKDERTDRTLRLTGLCLKLNPANYTVWHYRRRILGTLQTLSDGRGGEKGGGDGGAGAPAGEKANEPSVILPPDVLQAELSLAATLGGSNPKNYQIWYHRRALLEPLLATGGESDGKDPSEDDVPAKTARDELEYVAGVLDDDGKNYHAWSHRQWIVRTLSTPTLWSSELTYAHTLISSDPRNNSAWNHRWFASHRGKHVPLSTADATQESDYAIGAAGVDPHNESPWRYLIGIVKEQVRRSDSSPSSAASELVDRMEKEAKRVRDSVVDGPCPNADAARIDLLELRGDEAARSEAADLADLLGRKDDTIRRMYWTMRVGQLRDA